MLSRWDDDRCEPGLRAAMTQFFWASLDPPTFGDVATNAQLTTGVELIAIDEISPEEEALDAALIECGVTETGQRDQIFDRLIDLPGGLQEPIDHRRGLYGTSHRASRRALFKSDRDTLAVMLRLKQGRFDLGAAWKELSRAERMAAMRLWDWFTDLSNSSAEPKGRPAELDAALVLYLAFVLREAFGREKFGYSTDPYSRKRGGPMLRALMAALNVHVARERRQQAALDCLRPIGMRDTPAPPKPEAVLRIIKLVNKPAFKASADNFGLPLCSGGVAENPAQFRHLVLAAGQRKPHVTD